MIAVADVDVAVAGDRKVEERADAVQRVVWGEAELELADEATLQLRHELRGRTPAVVGTGAVKDVTSAHRSSGKCAKAGTVSASTSCCEVKSALTEFNRPPCRGRSFQAGLV